jgi:hypothetical protein
MTAEGTVGAPTCLLKNIVLQAVLVPGNLLKAVARLHNAP